MLKKITFTGLDDKTNITEIRDLQDQDSRIEFGILRMKNYNTDIGKKRYPSYSKIKDFLHSLNNKQLSLHLCGIDYVYGILENPITWEYLVRDAYSRIQINCGPYLDADVLLYKSINYCLTHFERSSTDIIIQARSDWNGVGLLNKKHNLLLDTSMGKGKDLSYDLPCNNDKRSLLGFAGGIGPNNVKQVISKIQDNFNGNFTIDMETNIRTNDWLDIDKIKKTLDNIL